MIEPKVVFEPVLSRWRVESRGVGRDGWRLYRYFSTLDEAREAAQRLTDDALGYKYRVVDTKPSGAQPVYTVEALRGDNSPWNQIVSATSSREAYAYAKQCAGENNLKYRVVQTDADGAKIAQEVTPDGLGDLNPLNLLWIEKAEREATAWVTDAAHPKPKPCPPFAAYVDKNGSAVWVTDENSNLRCLSDQNLDPEKYAPFTRLLPDE